MPSLSDLVIAQSRIVPLGRFYPLLLTVIVWFDLLEQLPKPLLLSHWRHYPADYSWRLIWFAYLIQVLMLGFIVFLRVEFPLARGRIPYGYR